MSSYFWMMQALECDLWSARQLASRFEPGKLAFRAVRLPGLNCGTYKLWGGRAMQAWLSKSAMQAVAQSKGLKPDAAIAHSETSIPRSVRLPMEARVLEVGYDILGDIRFRAIRLRVGQAIRLKYVRFLRSL